MKPVVLLFNPSSRKGRSLKQKKRIERCLQDLGVDYHLVVTESEDHLRRSAAESAGKYETIVAVGGDTTFNITAGEILKYQEKGHTRGPVLGMMGTGSANDIVRGLGMEKIEDACRAIKNGNTKKMDVGRLDIINKSKILFFLGTVSLGLGTTVNRFVEDFLRRHRVLAKLKPFDQLFPGLFTIHHSFAKKKVPLTVEMTYPEYSEFEFSLLVFLNTPYYANGLKLGEDNGLFDGLLDCRVIRTTSFWNTLRTGMMLRRGGAAVTSLQAPLFKVSSREAVDIQLDGDIFEGVREMEITLLPGAIDVLTKTGP
ncbi:MAG: hypothetical protein GY950_26895 [bacterium]|nr:hypothetical protein [bacterium]